MPRRKKSADPSVPQMIPNPAWLESLDYREAKEYAKENMPFGLFGEDFFPEDYGKALPEDGGWIMLLVSVQCGKQLHGGKCKRIYVPHLSLWYATPTTCNRGLNLPHPYRKSVLGEVRQKQAVIQTPDGPVHVWPHEYKLIDINQYLEFCEEDGLEIHYLSDHAAVDQDALFYLRSRGIPKAEAQRMLLGTLKDPHYCWFSFAPEIAAFFGEGYGAGYLTSDNHARRAAAHRKRIA